ncbi:splicing factor u2af family auxilary factor large rrm domain-containing protein [Cystoisospora suis]|uniref:Splicing factor u2af family auxilary factor large rrm domain-containing protein n=1 Tax=Cystoisospora suis TaxID=483139 RepID=A0A2C6LBC0_9APIC|nr:splicing factor u2af family auxilary factor large rrm domain-containing protein [Cystoisospora suis]
MGIEEDRGHYSRGGGGGGGGGNYPPPPPPNGDHPHHRYGGGNRGGGGDWRGDRRGRDGGYRDGGGYSRSGGGPPPSHHHYHHRGGDRGGGGGDRGGGRGRSRSRSRDRHANNSNRGGGGGGERGSQQHYRRRNRDISTSHEKSRSRERRRRRTQAECIRRAGGFQKLADSEGHEPIRLFWDGFQWVAKTGAVNAAGGTDAALMNSTRKLRRLYFGNLPLHMGLTESAFQEIVWNEMRNRGFCIDPNSNPVLYVWFAKDKGNYGFVEFATVEETERALTMDGMLCMGIPLKVSRPNDYSTTSSVQTQAMSMMGQQAAALLIGQLAAPMGPPPGSTRYLRVLQICDPASMEGEEDYRDLLEDVKEGLEKAGKIVNAVVITPQNKASTPYELCDIILEYGTPAEVDACVGSMTGRKYMGKPIVMVRLEETAFQQYISPLLRA